MRLPTITLIACLTFGLFCCRLPLAAAAIPHETPETTFEREAFAFVQVLEKRPGTILISLDRLACAERALTGLRLNPRLALRFGTNLSACIEEHLAGPLTRATQVRILAYHKEKGELRFLCRATQRDGGVSYLDLMVERSRLAGCAIVDAFDYSTGLALSQIARDTIEARATESQKSDHQWLLGSRSEASKSVNAIDHFHQLARARDFAGAVAAYAKLPPAVQGERMVLHTQIRCATQADLPACSTALALWRKSFPEELTADLISLDYLKRRKLHDTYLEAVGRIDQQVGGDAGLDVIRARYCQEMGAKDRAETFARQAVEREPGVREAHQVLLALLLDRKDFAETARALSAQEKALSVNLGPTVRKAANAGGESAWPAFARSEEGVRWLAENEKQQAGRAAAAAAAATSSTGQYTLEGISHGGGRAVATINGRVVGLGDRLVGGVRVSRIGPVSVNLVSTNGDVETLTLNRGLAGADEPVLPE